MFAAKAGLVAVLLLFVAGCADQPGPAVVASSSSASPATTTGTLTGLVRLYGGPLDPKTMTMALNGAPGPDWPVKVMTGSRTVAEVKSDTAGRFRFVLPPGTYTLACGQEPAVTVVAGRTVAVFCDVPVP